jgi:hypothetical protein
VATERFIQENPLQRRKFGSFFSRIWQSVSLCKAKRIIDTKKNGAAQREGITASCPMSTIIGRSIATYNKINPIKNIIRMTNAHQLSNHSLLKKLKK